MGRSNNWSVRVSIQVRQEVELGGGIRVKRRCRMSVVSEQCGENGVIVTSQCVLARVEQQTAFQSNCKDAVMTKHIVRGESYLGQQLGQFAKHIWLSGMLHRQVTTGYNRYRSLQRWLGHTLLAQERRKASSSAMPSAFTYPLLAALVCCTRAGSNMPFSMGALPSMSSNSFLQSMHACRQSQTRLHQPP